MIVECDKYYMPRKNRVLLLPIQWREEFNISENDLLSVHKENNRIIITKKKNTTGFAPKFIKINKKGVITIPKAIDDELECRLHQLYINQDENSFLVVPVTTEKSS
ncbi:AbrB/MazE/SpoVT family DNA-binding domain-containing protein [Fictibacillus enclensis]|uniref:AbrB/MazE/SpoVT family DNA-binding domain-containing protein n=1 Tax=Fictibacillus enclensis TaxID=1017270 RepID=UPI0024C013A0|nr:AbrB/MazE/SpoVT family DNA-binding domain-containing protein [Fictibacillus enclensis]WHY72938.1 AbrB/MazE/SpoVT family DNA-binding domain-containing protein [Fictibacillus enclensis]